MTFHILTKKSCYMKNIEYEINVALNYKNEIINCKDEIKIKYNNFLIFGEK